jgi:hypothetical protein
MTRILLILILVFPSLVAAQERPTIDLPVALRQANYVNPITLEGSCTHATSIMLMRWQLQFDNADEWRNSYAGGDWADSTWNPTNNHAQKFDRQGIDFAYTIGDADFLDWALSTRRGCGLTVHGGAHAVLLVYLDDQWAAIIDNNDISNIQWVPRDRLISEWHNSNSWAWTVVGDPAPPIPR